MLTLLIFFAMLLQFIVEGEIDSMDGSYLFIGLLMDGCTVLITTLIIQSMGILCG